MSAESQSPAAEEMPEWVQTQVASARERTRDYADAAEPTIMRRYDKSLVYLADRVDALTRELSESRARAVQGEQDAKTLAYWIRGDTRATPAAVKATLARHEAVIGGPCEARTSTPTPDTGRNDSDE